MNHAGRSRAHRSKSTKNKRKRITLASAPVVAVVMSVPLMFPANAATPEEVAADCDSNSDKLESCEFIDVQAKQESFGPNQRVSKISDNCGVEDTATKSFSGTVESSALVQKENGNVAGFDGLLGNSFFNIGVKFQAWNININRDEKASAFTFTRSDTVEPNHIAFFMWSQKRVDASGYLKATYKEEQNGQKVFFSPSEGARTRHVFLTKLLSDGKSQDGRLWLRNVKCGTPEADALLNGSDSNPGFKNAGTNVSDTQVSLSEVGVG